MSKKKSSLRSTFQLIIDILSADIDNDILKTKLSNQHIDWDSLVVVASGHLLLPAIYCRLQQKNVLHYLPEDLVRYLEELTVLNRDRNRVLLEEAAVISDLFIANNITHVFIKGVAILAGNYFKDIGERMIGDIDILIAENDLDTAFDLLTKHGYTESISFNYEVKDYRHKPRQISKDHLGAIELHSSILKHSYDNLIDKEAFLSDSRHANNILIPTTDHLIRNSILAHQINDLGYFYHTVYFKTVYDLMALGLFSKRDVLERLSKEPYSSDFLNLLSVLNLNDLPKAKTSYSNLKKKTFALALDFPVYGRLKYKVKSLYFNTKERIALVLTNKSYRAHILKNKLK